MSFIHNLRYVYDSHRDARCKCAIDFLTVKLNPIEFVWGYIFSEYRIRYNIGESIIW